MIQVKKYPGMANCRMTLLINFILFSAVLMFGSTPKEMMHEAHRLLEDENYIAAEESYKGIVEQGYESASLYYNLGLINYHRKDFSEAILFFEKALKLRPGYGDAHKNLSFIRKEMIEHIYTVQPFFLWRAWTSIANMFPIWLWTLLSIIGLVTFVAGLYFWLLDRESNKKRLAFNALLISLFLIILSVLALNYRYKMKYHNPYGIVMKDIQKYEGPNELSAVEDESIPAGTKVKELDELSGWLKVQLPDLEVVYLKAEMIERI